jgi:hypothetical protein
MSRRVPETASCSAILDLLEAYVDAELDPESSAAVEAHVATCDGCRSELGLAHRVPLALRDLPELEPPRWVQAAIFREAEAGARDKRDFLGWRAVALPLAAGLAAAALGLSLWWASDRGAGVGGPATLARSASAEPTDEEIAQATREVRLVLARVGETQRRASLAAIEAVGHQVQRAAARGLHRERKSHAKDAESLPESPPGPSAARQPTLEGIAERSRA